MRLKLHKLIKPELEELKENCNFTDEESDVFNMLSRGKGIREISIIMNISEPTVSRRIKNIKEKIERIDKCAKSNKCSDLGENNIINY